MGESIFRCPFRVGFTRISDSAVAFIEHHFFAVMGPAFDERVAAKNFFHFAHGRCVQTQELDIMSGINFVNGNNVGGVEVE